MHKKIVSMVGMGFLTTGLIFIVVGAFFGVRHNNIVQNSDPIVGTIVDVSIQRRAGVNDPGEMRGVAYVEYEIGNETINTRLNWWNSSMRVGDPINLLVSRDDPRTVASDGVGGWLIPIIFTFFGVLFASIGIGLLMYQRRKANLRNWILTNGTQVWADVVGPEDDHRVLINGKPATVLVATYNGMRFTSDFITNKEIQNVGERVKIWLHPDDPDKYTFEF